jgi:DNA adenine methylase
VLLRKPRSYAEVYNDLDGDVVCLFRVLRDQADADRLIHLLRLTPFAADEFKAAYEAADDPVERARRLIARSFMGHGSNSHAKPSGFRANANRSGTIPARDFVNYPDALAATIERLRGVVVENKPALSVMQQHDGPKTPHYVDPPYLAETRDSGADYRHEMATEDHVELLTALRGLVGMVVLSGYPAPLYDNMLPGWQRIERKSFADGARERTEVLWINPAAAKAREDSARQTSVFEPCA